MKRIGELLVDNGLITQTQIEAALTRQKTMASGTRIGEILIDMGFLTYDVLLTYLEKQMLVKMKE